MYSHSPYDRHAALKDAVKAARNGRGMLQPKDSPAYEAAQSEYLALCRSLHLSETQRASEAAAREHAATETRLRNDAATGLERARASKRTATATLEALRADLKSQQVKVDAIKEKAATAEREYEAAKRAQVDRIVEGHDPEQLSPLPDFASAIRRVQEPLVGLDAKVRTAEQAIVDADKAIARALLNQALAAIYQAVLPLREHVLVAKQARHVAQIDNAGDWASLLTVSMGSGGFTLHVADPSLSDPDVLGDELLRAYRSAASEPDHG